jgi:adenylate cyclase
MFRFEGYTLDVARNLLRTVDREVALRPKSFELLRYLVENPDRLVTKEELLKAIWPDVIVTDHVLINCVGEVRQAISDDEQTIIKTIPRRGYRFTVPVLRIATNAASGAPSPCGDGSAPLGAGVSRGSSPTPDPSAQRGGELARVGDRPSVAVLPFANLSGDPQQEYFSDGMTEDITTELSRFSELMVIARNSSFRYKGKAVDIRQAAHELGARYVVEGSVRRSGGRIRIAAQLIDAVTGAHRWAERYDREPLDVFAVQDEVARTIVAILAAHVTGAETERVLLKPPAAWEAYEYYLRGAEAFFLHYYNRRTKASLYDARRLLEQSLAIDPAYARAAAALSETHVYAYVESHDGDYLSPAALDRALELAETAVRVAPHLPQAPRSAWICLDLEAPARRRHRRIRARLRAQPQFHRPSMRPCLGMCGRAGKSDRATRGKHPPRSFCAAHLLVRLYGRGTLHAQTVPGGAALAPRVCIARAEYADAPCLARVRLRAVGTT